MNVAQAGVFDFDLDDSTTSTVQPSGLNLSNFSAPDLPADSTFRLSSNNDLSSGRSKFYRFEFDLPSGYSNLSFLLQLGVNDEFAAYLNDQLIAVQDDTDLANFREPYPGVQLNANNTAFDPSGGKLDGFDIDQSLFREGTNELTILAVDTGGGGGLFDLTAIVRYSLPPHADLEGTSVTCGLEDTPERTEGGSFASCNAIANTIRASADLDNAEIKVYAADSGSSEDTEGTAIMTDLITVVDGFSANGTASGTLRVDVSGIIDDSTSEHEGEAIFRAILWYPTGPVPPCLDDIDVCGLEDGPYGYAEVDYDQENGELDIDVEQGGGGQGTVTLGSTDASDLLATLTIPWGVNEENPTFYVSVFGLAEQDSGAPGTTDFTSTARATLTGPDGFEYSGKNGFAINRTGAQRTSTRVALDGRVATIRDQDICALVLVSGRFVFSCNPNGPYALQDLPRESDETVRRQVYAAGFFPLIEDLRGNVHETIVMQRSGTCPSFNPPSQPVANPANAGQQQRITGNVLAQNSQEPVCALVLAGGQFVFSCNSTGSYDLTFPLDSQGQYKLQVYASGFAPAIQTFDSSATGGDVRLTRANACR